MYLRRYVCVYLSGSVNKPYEIATTSLCSFACGGCMQCKTAIGLQFYDNWAYNSLQMIGFRS